jgi:1,4-dihydroxy-2-naphthoate octaprenyltransferase
MFGVVGEVGTYYIQAAATYGRMAPWELLGSLPLSVVLAGLPAGALVTSVMLIDDLRDCEVDRAKGWRTTAVSRGPSFTCSLITVLVVASFLAPFVLWAAPGFKAWVLLPLLSAPLAYRTVRGVRNARYRSDLIPMTPRMAGLAAIYSALLALGITLSG